MVSLIDPSKPTSSTAFTNDVRVNFQAAKDEIQALQLQVKTYDTSFITGSQIDPTQPPFAHATTAEVRENFQHAKDEIEALQIAIQAIIDGGVPGTTMGFLLEDGSGLIMLEDGSGFIVQEAAS